MLRLVVSVIAVALIQVLTAIGLLLQWAPLIARALWRTLAAFLALSVVVYRRLLNHLPARLQTQPWRTLMCLALSLTSGLAGLTLLGWPVTTPALALLVIHGLAVSSAWDDLGPPRGQLLGR